MLAELEAEAAEAEAWERSLRVFRGDDYDFIPFSESEYDNMDDYYKAQELAELSQGAPFRARKKHSSDMASMDDLDWPVSIQLWCIPSYI
jgi:hypothetical protein